MFRDDDKYILRLETTQTNMLKTLFEVIKEILMHDINIEFTEKGMFIFEVSSNRIVLVKLELPKNCFEVYKCTEPVTVGINCTNFNKIIKTITNQDSISFLIEKDNRDKFIVSFENNIKKKRVDNYIKLLNIDKDPNDFGDIKFDFTMKMKSTELQKLCRDLDSVTAADACVEIISTNSQIHFICRGEFADHKITIDHCKILNDKGSLDESSNGIIEFNYEDIEDTEDVEEQECNSNSNGGSNGGSGGGSSSSSNGIVQGVFLLKYLKLFTKATSLSKFVRINIDNNYPLFITYPISNGDSGSSDDIENEGRLILILSPYSTDESSDEEE